jgi:TRAP-type C4-dicarboxylate transport system permease small subunit
VTAATASSTAQRPSWLGPDRTPWPLRALAHLNRVVALAEGAGLGLFLGALMLLASWQFVARNLRDLGVDPAPLWIDSVIRHAVFFIGFLGGAFATHVIKHLRVDAMTRLMPVRARLAVRILTTAFACVICILLVRAGWAFHADIVANEAGDVTMEGELITAARGTLAVPLGFGLITFHFIVQILLDLAWILTGEEPPSEWLAEAHGEAGPPSGAQGEALDTATRVSEEL